MKVTLDLTSDLFTLGEIVVTPGALRTCTQAFIMECVQRHARGDWGAVWYATAAENGHALLHGGELASLYRIEPPRLADGEPGSALWIITAQDRSSTTITLPEEYEP